MSGWRLRIVELPEIVRDHDFVRTALDKTGHADAAMPRSVLMRPESPANRRKQGVCWGRVERCWSIAVAAASPFIGPGRVNGDDAVNGEAGQIRTAVLNI